MTGQEKFEKAKQRVLLEHRFFASMMMRMKWVADESCNTAWVNGRTVGYNPKYFEQITVRQGMGVVVHEIFHPMLKHHLRIGNKDFELWNEAGDYAINPLIIRYGFELPEGVLLDYRFEGMSAEQIYSILVQERQEEKQKQKEKEKNQDQSDNQDGQDEQSGGQDQPDNQDQSSDQDDNQKESGNQDGQDEDQKESGDQDQDDQDQDDHDQSESDQSGQGIQNEKKSFRDEVRPAVDESGKEADEAERTAQEIEIDIAVTQAAKFAEKAGQGFSGMDRLVKDISTTETPWQQILQNFLYESAKTEYNWSRPSRRHEQYFPSLQNYEAGNIAIVIDSSGSINDDVFNRFINEISTTLENISSEVWVIVADDQIQEAKQISADDLRELKPKGFGGTDFIPAFKWLEENDVQPKALIYLTDLECNSFPEEPNFPVLWAAYGRSAHHAEHMPFGEKIILR